MTRIKRGGRELVVADSAVAEYLRQGYSVIDDKGNELTRAQATTFSQLKAEYDILKKRFSALNAELEAVKAENVQLKTCRDERIAELEAQIGAMSGETITETPENKAGNTRKPVPTASTNKSSSGGKTPAKAK